MRTFLATLFIVALALGALTGPAAASTCAVDGPITCDLEADALVVHGPQGSLTLSGTWHADGDAGRFVTGDPFAIETDAGAIPVATGGGEVTVTCSPYFAISGAVAGVPTLGDIWPSSDVSTSTPVVEIGMALGEQLSHISAPIAPCETYLFFHADTAVSASSGEASLTVVAGDQAVVLINPWDPGFFVEVGGKALSDATFGFVARAGYGISRTGLLRWQSTVDLPTGAGADAGLAPLELYGHVYQTGKFGLIPIPKSPVQLYIDGSVVADLGPFPEAAEAIAAGLLSGEVADAQEVLDDHFGGKTFAEVMHEVALGANVDAMTLAVGPFSLDLAEGAFVVDGGILRWAAESWSPGEALEQASTGLVEIDELMQMLAIKATYGSRGYVDGERYRFELYGDVAVGPVEIDGATIIIDSEEGVSVVRPDTDIDFVDFVDRLKELFHCDFSEGVVGCNVAGFEVTGAVARFSGGDLSMAVDVDMMGLASGRFELRRRRDGQFIFALDQDIALGPFMTTKTNLRISPHGVWVNAKVANMGMRFKVKGHLKKRDGTVRYDVKGTGEMRIAGFKQVEASVRIHNVDGLTAFTIDAVYSPFAANPLLSDTQVRFTGAVDGDYRYTLTGSGELVVMGYDLGEVAMKLSNRPGQGGFSFVGSLDMEIVHAELQGRIRAADEGFSFTGTGEIAVTRAPLMDVAFTLDDVKGLSVTARLDLGALEVGVEGGVEPDGSFRFDGAAGVEIPVITDFQVFEKIACGTEYVTDAVECGTETIRDGAACGWDWVTSAVECGTQTLTDAIQCGTSTIKDAVQCGTTTLQSAAECGTTTFTDAAKCGVDTITSGTQCGWDTITSAARCGVDTITSATQCGLDYVTSAAKCGTKVIEDAAICGTEIITDAVECGFDVVQEGAECMADWLACGFKIGCDPIENPPESCKIARTCEVAKECTVAKSCWTAGTCDIPKTCDVPKTCQIANTCAVANTCTVANTCEVARSCHVPSTCEVPSSCQVTQYCDSWDTQHDQHLGVFRGDLRVSVRHNTYWGSASGRFCNSDGACTESTLGGGVSWGTPPQVCFYLPVELLPIGAIFSRVNGDGDPRVCINM